MRLAYIKLAGFKSFVEPSKIPFPDPMTCVVGPNGCGKSNVIDAVRWVLGESSAKNLRGDAMADVIFNGSIERKPVSQASVELMFDNTQGRLPGTLAARNQISIKRLVTREGISQYFLNGETCRKRDITDIFLGTGLGPRSYAIIEQGMISRLIESKPQDLRVFIEEAAGVSKYKERRRETQTRLNSTRDNLERLLDLRTELDSQITVLSEQADKAKQYTLAKTKERTLKAQICVLKWQTLQNKLTDCEHKLSDINQQIDFFEAANTGHTDVIAALKLSIEQANDVLNNVQHQEYQLRNKLARDEQDKVHKQSQKTQLFNQSLQLEKQQQSLINEHRLLQQKSAEIKPQLVLCVEELEQCIASVALSIEKLDLQKDTQDEYYTNYQNTLALYQSISSEKSEKQQQLTQLNIELTKLKQQKIALFDKSTELEKTEKELNSTGLDTELNALKTEQSNAHTQFTQANASVSDVKQQLVAQKQDCEQVEQGFKALKAKRDALQLVVSQNETNNAQSVLAKIEVDKDWLLAVEACLFGLTQASITKQFSDNLTAPAVWQDTASVKSDSLAAKIREGSIPRFFNAIALAADLSNFDESLWQQGFIAAVNQQGDLRGPNWFIPSSFDQDNSNLVKYQLLKDIEVELVGVEKRVEHAQAEQAKLQSQLQQQQAELSTRDQLLREVEHALTRKQTQWDLAEKQLSQTRSLQLQTRSQLNTINEQLSHIETKIEPLQIQFDEKTEQLNQIKNNQSDSEQAYHHAVDQTQRLQAECDQQKSQHHNLQLQLTTLKNQQAICDNELEQADKQNSHNGIHQQEIKLQLEEAEIPLLELDELIVLQHESLELLLEEKEAKRTLLDAAKENLLNAEKNITNEQGKLDELTQKKQQAELDKQSFLLKSEATLAPLDELNMRLKEVIEALPQHAKLTSLQAILSRTINDIESLGAINLTAVEEYDKASDRKLYLDQQYDDLTTALDTLETAITKIDRETKQRFKGTFDQINTGLQDLFPKVFGGGHAYLELTSDDLLDTGVTIMARPPGKKNATIHLLSGGEKALTALSLVFSIFQLNPAPFCMLDEVDAPLDDANVGRFCRLVEEMSKDVQFIYISHNKISMEMAARLTGVTMAEPGVSRVVAVDIEKALEMTQSA